MAVQIQKLDWRSDDTNIATQEIAMNNFLSSKALDFVTAVDEYIIAIYRNANQSPRRKVKIFKVIDNIADNGVSSIQTTIENFLVGKTVFQIINLDSGTILLIYG